MWYRTLSVPLQLKQARPLLNVFLVALQNFLHLREQLTLSSPMQVSCHQIVTLFSLLSCLSAESLLIHPLGQTCLFV
jgi:hypothetical protein